MNLTVTNIIAIISLILSLCNWLYILYKNKRHIAFDLRDTTFTDYIDGDYGFYDIDLIIKNLSSAPISICYFELIDNSNESYLCNLSAGLEFHKFNHMIDTDTWYEKFIESADFPLNFVPHQASHEYIHIEFPKDKVVKKCYIHLSKGSKIHSQEIVDKLNSCNRYNNGNKYFPKESDTTNL